MVIFRERVGTDIPLFRVTQLIYKVNASRMNDRTVV